MSETRIESVPVAAHNDDVESYLTGLEEKIQEGKLYMKLGADTNFIKNVRSVMSNPQQALETVTELLGKAFVLIFWERMQEKKFTLFLSDIGLYRVGSKVRIWIYLKPDHYNFETRSKFYELKAEIANNDIFAKLEIDLMMLNEGEVDLPASYESLMHIENA